jgi:formate-dependent nitrite reductase membrane component NrfD
MEEYKRRWGEGRRGGRSAGDETRGSYYGLPVLHAPHWGWLVIVYFFLGGISGAAYVIAAIAALFGGPGARPIVRAGRYLSLAALVPCPPLLIADLGRPERFHHMLRVLKLRSAMSVGTWGLTLFGLFSGLSAVLQAADDGLLGWLGRPMRLLRLVPRAPVNAVGACFGFFVAGYTGVLLGLTAVPAWARNRLLLGPLFLCSAMGSAGAAIALLLAPIRRCHAALRRIHRLEAIALPAEAALLAATYANLGAVIGRPLRAGQLARLWRWGVLGGGVGLPLLLRLLAPRAGRAAGPLNALASLATLAGGLCLRYVMVRLGAASAADPEATFEFTRRRPGR